MGKPKKTFEPNGDTTNDYVISGKGDPYSRTDDQIHESGMYVVDLSPAILKQRAEGVFIYVPGKSIIFPMGGVHIYVARITDHRKTWWEVRTADRGIGIYRASSRDLAENFLDRLAGLLSQTGMIVISTGWKNEGAKR